LTLYPKFKRTANVEQLPKKTKAFPRKISETLIAEYQLIAFLCLC